MLSFSRKKSTSTGVSNISGDGAGQGTAPELSLEAKEMGFLDHLEEFRWSLLRGMIAVLVCTVVAAFFSEWIIDTILLGPTRQEFISYRIFGIEVTPFTLQNRTVTGQFFADWGTIFSVGIIMGSPLFVYFIWSFIEPGLYPEEKKGMRFVSVFATFFFLLGIGFGYFVITPLALQFFAQYQISPDIVNEFDVTKYFGMITFWSFGVGMLFQMPVVIYFLAKMGLATPDGLRKARRWAIIAALVLGALFTPPDPISQVLVAIPLIGLYELSIMIASVVHRRRQRELAKALA